MPSRDLDNLASLLKSPHALVVLQHLRRASDELKVSSSRSPTSTFLLTLLEQAKIESEMLEKFGWTWMVQVGFHASESMRHVHLHVISSDLISPKLKNKKYTPPHPPSAPRLTLDYAGTTIRFIQNWDSSYTSTSSSSSSRRVLSRW